MYFQLLSILGAVLILVAYVAHQLRKMSAETVMYQALNCVGGLFLLVTAYADRQYGFILMEGSSPRFSQAFVARQRRAAWMRGARRFRDEGIVDTMLRSETVVQRSRQAAIRCRSRRSVRNAGQDGDQRVGIMECSAREARYWSVLRGRHATPLP